MSSHKNTVNIKLIKKSRNTINNAESFEKQTSFLNRWNNLVLSGEDHPGNYASIINKNISVSDEYDAKDLEEFTKLITYFMKNKKSIFGSSGTVNDFLNSLFFPIRNGMPLYSNRAPIRGNKKILDFMVGDNAILGDLFVIQPLIKRKEYVATAKLRHFAEIFYDTSFIPCSEKDISEILKEWEYKYPKCFEQHLGNSSFTEAFSGKFSKTSYLCIANKKDGLDTLNYMGQLKKHTIRAIVFSPDLQVMDNFNKQNPFGNSNVLTDGSKKKAIEPTIIEQIDSLFNMKTSPVKVAGMKISGSDLVLVGNSGDSKVSEPFYVVVNTDKIVSALALTHKKFDEVQFRVGQRDLNENMDKDKNGYAIYPVAMIDKKTKEVISILQEQTVHCKGKNDFLNRENTGRRYDSWNYGIGKTIELYKHFALLDV